MPDVLTAGRTSAAAFADAVRAEDVALAAWLIFGGPLVAGLGLDTSLDGLLGDGGPVLGLACLVAIVGAVACAFTRTSDAPAGEGGGMLARSAGALGPFVGGLGLVGAGATTNLGLGDGGLAIGIVAGMIAAFAPGPPISTAWRRALVMPFVLVTGSVFDSTVAQFGGSFALTGALGHGLADDLRTIGLSLGLTALLSSVFYAMLVYAPRQVAEREGGGFEWLVRFGLFVVATVVGAGWLRAVTG